MEGGRGVWWGGMWFEAEAKQSGMGFEAGALPAVDDSSNATMCETFCPV